MSLALPSDFIPLSPTQPLACIYRGAVGEDHFDVGMEMSFGVCEDEYSRLHYLAVPEQLRSLVIGGAYELEVQRVDRPAYADAVRRAEALNATWNGPGGEHGATWTRRHGYAIRHIRRAPPPRRRRTTHAASSSSVPAVGSQTRSLLSVRLLFTDYTPSYCDESCVLNGFTRTPRQPGTVEYAMEVASYEILSWSSVRVINLNMNDPVSRVAGCDYESNIWATTRDALTLIPTQYPGRLQ